MNIDTTVLASVASAVAAGAALATVIFVYRQVREADRSRQVTVILPLYEWFRSPRARDIRRRLLAGEIDVDAMSASDQEALDDLLGRFELIAILVRYGLVERDVIDDVFLSAPTDAYRAATKYVARRRKHTTSYAQNLERIAAEE